MLPRGEELREMSCRISEAVRSIQNVKDRRAVYAFPILLLFSGD
jgi:hypothetical protein